MTVDEIMELVFDYADQRKYGRVGAANSNPVRSAIESIVKDAEARGWQPIETAPKDGTAVLVYPGTWSGRSASIAKWESNKYAKTPRPYWSRDDDLGRVTFSREHPPTHWMPLPLPLDNEEFL